MAESAATSSAASGSTASTMRDLVLLGQLACAPAQLGQPLVELGVLDLERGRPRIRGAQVGLAGRLVRAAGGELGRQLGRTALERAHALCRRLAAFSPATAQPARIASSRSARPASPASTAARARAPRAPASARSAATDRRCASSPAARARSRSAAACARRSAAADASAARSAAAARCVASVEVARSDALAAWAASLVSSSCNDATASRSELDSISAASRRSERRVAPVRARSCASRATRSWRSRLADGVGRGTRLTARDLRALLAGGALTRDLRGRRRRRARSRPAPRAPRRAPRRARAAQRGHRPGRRPHRGTPRRGRRRSRAPRA